MRQSVLLGLLLLVMSFPARGDSLTDRLEDLQSDLKQAYSIPIEHWNYFAGDPANADAPDFDDSAWRQVSPRFAWRGDGTNAWLRAKVVFPQLVNGDPITGRTVRLAIGLSNTCELYVDGKLRDFAKGNDGVYTLTENARVGQTFNLALRSVNKQDGAVLRFARLEFDFLPELGQYIDEAKFVSGLVPNLRQPITYDVPGTLASSESCVQFTDLSPTNLGEARMELVHAQEKLRSLAPFTKQFEVFFVGHAHIDMNWKWDWAETIDVCHRTWNSAMNLMDEFPQFQFVQSQPAAYVPIESEFPEEFRRMQAMSASNRWDIVGGLWNESDTDIPSGEGLARSFLLGQSYFKAKFGRYARTGWLPDSFGHSWQLPQIMKLCGIDNFYHERCGNGMDFTWWEAPDGSRVLKAQTPSYDAKPKLEQLLTAVTNWHTHNTPQALVVFGVGDHGGGPTREQILRIESFQRDPILPTIRFVSADEFFDQLSPGFRSYIHPGERGGNIFAPFDSFPVIDGDLQYTFEGCYTTHADIKAALRSSENELYSAEVLAALDSLTGKSYPVAGFDEAWKPVAFAQFHDISCGSAIHSTYDWMHKQLAPAFQFAREQTGRALNDLTADVDTRGPGPNALVVWNTLSFPRTDVVEAVIPNAKDYHSVRDALGHEFPAQLKDDNKLVFVARDVPAFGHSVYFPQIGKCAGDGVTLRASDRAYEIENAAVSLRVERGTGALSELILKSDKWDVIGHAPNANAFQILGDSGSAWTIKYTGENRILTTDGAKVTVLDEGPVFVRLRVNHAYGQSVYEQDITVYGALPRLDIPTRVDWHEEHQLLKIDLPVNANRPIATGQIPFGSIDRPINGQECPGQKWMDLGELSPIGSDDSMQFDLTPFYNSDSTGDFDGDGNAYAAKLMPSPGIHNVGSGKIPFLLGESGPGHRDNITGAHQKIPLPTGAEGELYLLAARAKGRRATEIGFELSDGQIELSSMDLSDWSAKNPRGDSIGFAFPFRMVHGQKSQIASRIWICHLTIPEGAKSIILPDDPEVHIFAATTVRHSSRPVIYGLSVLNDCKFGFDVSNSIFRLTALRSSAKPDLHPDTGVQQFTYSLYPHDGGWEVAHTDEQALALNVPLLAKWTAPHPPVKPLPTFAIENVGGEGDLIASALKMSEAGDCYVLRFYETQGRDTRAKITFDRPVQIEEADLLERRLAQQHYMQDGNVVFISVGHNKIVTLRLRF